jgi:hypothetical protein
MKSRLRETRDPRVELGGLYREREVRVRTKSLRSSVIALEEEIELELAAPELEVERTIVRVRLLGAVGAIAEKCLSIESPLEPEAEQGHVEGLGLIEIGDRECDVMKGTDSGHP